jgi:hypothetical protein
MIIHVESEKYISIKAAINKTRNICRHHDNRGYTGIHAEKACVNKPLMVVNFLSFLQLKNAELILKKRN